MDTDVAQTFVGGSIDWQCQKVTANASAWFAIVLVRDGVSASTISLSVPGTPYEPEQDVLWSKHMVTTDLANGEIKYGSDRIKTMRKMRTGDKILFVGLAGAASAVRASVNLTHFYKQ